MNTLAFFHGHIHMDGGGAFLALLFFVFVVVLVAFGCSGNRKGGT